MAHYAFLDENNVVVEVITGRDEDEVVNGISDWEEYYGRIRGLTCKRTSYNTHKNQHTEGGVPFRGNYAGIGCTYDPERDVFIGAKPFQSWVLNEETYSWVAPIPQPENNSEHFYTWDEASVSWLQHNVADYMGNSFDE